MITLIILTIEVLRIFIACRTNQGSEALHHFAPKLIEAIPGNALYIIVPIKSGHFFVQAKKKRKKSGILNALKTKLHK